MPGSEAEIVKTLCTKRHSHQYNKRFINIIVQRLPAPAQSAARRHEVVQAGAVRRGRCALLRASRCFQRLHARDQAAIPSPTRPGSAVQL